MTSTGERVELSVVVVLHNMVREAQRTLLSLCARYQRHIRDDQYEIIVVDNGSDVPVDGNALKAFGDNVRLIRIDAAPPSPAHAVNRGIASARGEVIGVMIDGARLATPGLLHFGLHGARLFENAVAASLGWYIGDDFQGFGLRAGYQHAREDALLDSVAWPSDGYRLFEIGTMDESSAGGWLRTASESNAVFAKRRLWATLGGLDERFDAPGGGLVNLDTFNRLLAIPDAELVVLLGEATFHQMHGGISTNAAPKVQSARFADWAAQYAAIRQRPWQPPVRTRPTTYVGTLPAAALPRFAYDALRAHDPGAEPRIGWLFRDDGWGRELAPTTPQPIARVVQLALDEFRAGRLAASCGLARLVAERAPGEPALGRMLSLVAPTVGPDGPAVEHRAEYHTALGDALAILGDTEAAARQFKLALDASPDLPRAHWGLAQLRMPGDGYLVWLERLYRVREPSSVIEIGVFTGDSLARCRPPTIAIGVDPEGRLLSPPATQVHLFPETSDAFFARRAAEPLIGSTPLSIGFIDGLHVFEQALRDFIGLEALCDDQSIIVLHDTVPLDEETQHRSQTTGFWTGDVWKLVLCLKHFRPELDIFTIPTAPSGLTVVSGLNGASRVLADAYGEAVARFIDAPFASIANDPAAALNVVPLVSVEERLARFRRRPAPSREPPSPLGTNVLDRDQPAVQAADAVTECG